VIAQSVGGGGGDGGYAISAAASDGMAVSFSAGGSGGGGGSGGIVQATNGVEITTAGSLSTAVLAQSVGGGGGNGGYAISAAASKSASVAVSVGGSGGGGGHGSAVTLDNSGTVRTTGAMSHALQAQSIGGGGGNAGLAVAAGVSLKGPAGAFSIGGEGGAGSQAGDVTLRHSGTLSTGGDESIGLFAQSIGGGGGNGGFAGTITASFDPSQFLGALGASVGGTGGGGGFGGTVNVVDSGSIQTLGAGSHGIMAQSLGGGGGKGGGAFTFAGAMQKSLAVSVGGAGGSADQHGGRVDVTASGSIGTQGADAVGILAQSVGGGGGSGGFAVSGALTLDKSGAASVAVGGKGGSGSNGGAVTVNALADISTRGAGAHAVLAQSTGGGGGRGGFAGALTVNTGSLTGNAVPSNFSLAIGGTGGGGGDAGQVTVNTAQDHVIGTKGVGASAIKALSTGGGGGDGGFAFSIGLTVPEGNATPGSLQVALGGAGGNGGTGADVLVDNKARLVTEGARATGLYAQSVGGGGGAGGFSATGALNWGNEAWQASVSLGGNGGQGQSAGAVTVRNAGAITTAGDHADAIFAQSTGGGGGDGGLAIAGALSGGNGGKQMSVAVGGRGGNAVNSIGANVTVENSAHLQTTLEYSRAIFAQSVGGGGGRGGMAVGVDLATNDVGTNVNIGTTVGGQGGSGNRGGNVTVANSASLDTGSYSSSAIFAQSVGGGGGEGGMAVTALVSKTSREAGSKARTVNAAVAIGGSGGTGGDAGNVKVSHLGSSLAITTLGEGSHGIFAQSVGGGGGVSGQANTLSLLLGRSCIPGDSSCKTADPSKNNLDYKVAVGGSGGAAGDGGAVDVGSEGRISTAAGYSAGIFAQSVGGGGGTGGLGSLGAPTLGDEIYEDPNLYTDLLTFPKLGFGKANKLVPYKAAGVAVGGSGGASGAGGDVRVTQGAGSISTQGEFSQGILAQSVGGGGGVGGVGANGLMITVGIGGAGGAAGDGGKVSVDNRSTLHTLGANSSGIFAQSIGGGGGVAGQIKASGLLSKAIKRTIGIGVQFGRDGGGGGDGGAVTVTNAGSITTEGGDSAAIFAQSIGGGGGVLGEAAITTPNFMLGSVGAAGSAAEVRVDSAGTLRTLGEFSDGIFAQSTGGLGTGGDVTVNAGGSIHTLGQGSSAIRAQSLGTAGNGRIHIGVQAGAVLSSSGTDDAVITYLDGKDNQLVNFGTLSHGKGLAGLLIDGGAAVLDVTNHGVMQGSVDLGDLGGQFSNMTGGRLFSGASLKLGSAGSLYNGGKLSIGGDGLVGTTQLQGNFVQGQSGRLFADLSIGTAGATSDRLEISGLAGLGGSIHANLLDPGHLRAGEFNFTLVSSQDSLTQSALSLVAPSSAVARYALVQTGNQLQLQLKVDYAPTALLKTPAQSAVGAHINSIQAKGGSEAFSPIAVVLQSLDEKSLGTLYGRLAPELPLQQVATVQADTRRFSDQLFSCIAPESAWHAGDDESCLWARHEDWSRDSTSRSFGSAFHQAGDTLSFGLEGALGNGWRLGVGAGGQRSEHLAPGLAASHSHQGMLGVSLKRHAPLLDTSLAVAAGRGSRDLQREVLSEAGLVADSRSAYRFLSVALRASRHWGSPRLWVKPEVELAAGATATAGYVEQGAGPLSLRVQGATYEAAHLRPAVEVGAEFRLGSLGLRPLLKAGVLRRLGARQDALDSGFVSQPDGVEPLQLRNTKDPTVTEVSVGTEVLWGAWRGRLAYTRQAAQEFDGRQWQVKASMAF
jgi:hypothetical protein